MTTALEARVLALWRSDHDTMDIADDAKIIAILPRLGRHAREALGCRIIHADQDLRDAKRRTSAA